MAASKPKSLVLKNPKTGKKIKLTEPVRFVPTKRPAAYGKSIG